MNPLLMLLLAHMMHSMSQQQGGQPGGKPNQGANGARTPALPGNTPSAQGRRGMNQGHRGITGPTHAAHQAATTVGQQTPQVNPVMALLARAGQPKATTFGGITPRQ